jgi:hypothetical protein
MTPQERRHELLTQYRAQAREVYAKAVADGEALPVVLVIDTADPDGRLLAETNPAYQTTRPRVFVTAMPLANLLAGDGPLRTQPNWRRAIEMVTQQMPAVQRRGEGWVPMSPHQLHLVAIVAADGFACHPMPLETPS